MKHLLTLALVMAIAVISHAQFTGGMSAGQTQHHLLIQGEAGYLWQNWYTGIDIRSQPTASKAHIGVRSGLLFRLGNWRLMPAAGYYHRLESTDVKSRNGFETAFSLKTGYKWLYADITRMAGQTQFSIGVFATLPRDSYCN